MGYRIIRFVYKLLLNQLDWIWNLDVSYLFAINLTNYQSMESERLKKFDKLATTRGKGWLE